MIGYPQARGAIAQAERMRRVSSPASMRAVERLDAAWEQLFAMDVDGSVALHAGALSVRHGLRALDAVHLASALTLGDVGQVLVSWDDELRRAAEAEGLALAPA